MDKRWLLVAGLVAGVGLFIIFLVPFFVNAEAFRPTIESQLSGALGRDVTMGKLSFSLMQGSLTAEDIAIADDLAFSSVPFVQAKKLDLSVSMIPLLIHRKVEINGVTIDAPSFQLIKHSNGRWNYSSLGSRPADSSSPPRSTPMPEFSVGKLKIQNGSALVSSIPVASKPFEFTDVNLSIKQFSFRGSFPFEVSAKLQGGGTLRLTGDAGPISQKDTSQTPFSARLELREFDPVAAGVIDRNKGISMTTDVDADLKSDGANATSSGKIKASRLQLAPKSSPAQIPVEIDYSMAQNLASREGEILDVAIHSGTTAVHMKGSFKESSGVTLLNLHLSAPALPLEQLEQLLPIVGFRLPGGSSLQGGTLTANIAVTGPATGATMIGPLEIANTKLAGFDLGSRIEGLHLGGTVNGTNIQVLKAKVNSSPAGTHFTDIYGEMPQIGTASGEGDVAPSGELSFRLIAKLNDSNAIGVMNSQAIDKVNGTIGGLLHPNAKPSPASGRGIPILITGTASNPSIRANMGAPLR